MTSGQIFLPCGPPTLSMSKYITTKFPKMFSIVYNLENRLRAVPEGCCGNQNRSKIDVHAELASQSFTRCGNTIFSSMICFESHDGLRREGGTVRSLLRQSLLLVSRSLCENCSVCALLRGWGEFRDQSHNRKTKTKQPGLL